MKTATSLRTILHLGCGNEPLPKGRFPPSEWEEIRVDLDPDVEPDVVADIRDLPFPDDFAHAISCFACLEHIEESSVAKVLLEFNRVLKNEGELLVVVPDLKAVAREIVNGNLNHVVEQTPAGPIRPLDMLYGLAGFVQRYPLMAHRTGFTEDTLRTWLGAAGFSGRIGHPSDYLLIADVRKGFKPNQEFREITEAMVP